MLTVVSRVLSSLLLSAASRFKGGDFQINLLMTGMVDRNKMHIASIYAESIAENKLAGNSIMCSLCLPQVTEVTHM